MADPSAELERYVRVGGERVGEGDSVVAVRDVPFCDENRRQVLAGQDFLQVVQHARMRQWQWYVLSGSQGVVGAAADDWQLLQFLRQLLGPICSKADAEVVGSGGVVMVSDVL